MNTNPQAKTIVCYGDSNTWGDMPEENKRYLADERWVGVLQDVLGNDYDVVNEGLCGRTFVAEKKEKPHRTGITHLSSIIKTNNPVDVVTIMLGTNDMKSGYGLSSKDIAEHLRQTIQLIKAAATEIPHIIVICPPPVINASESSHKELLYAPSLSLELNPKYKKVSREEGCDYINAGDFISLEHTDGYHLAKEHHKLLGEEVAKIIEAG